MGKASRRKKEKRAQGKQEAQTSPKSKKGKLLAKGKNKSKKRTTTVTIEALDKKAKAVESALTSVVKKAQEVRSKKEGKLKKPKKAEPQTIKEKKAATKAQKAKPAVKAPEKKEVPVETVDESKTGFMTSIAGIKESIVGDLDSEKWKNFKEETKSIATKVGYTTVAIVAVVSIIMVQELASDGRTLPGTKAAGVEIGYMPLDKAWEKLSQESEQYLNQPLIFAFEGDTFQVPNSDLGIQISVDETMHNVPSFQFERENPVHFLASLLVNHEIEPVYSYDRDRVIRVLEREMNIAHRKPSNARFVYTDGTVQIQPEKSGFEVNSDYLVDSLENNISQLSTATIDVTIEPKEPTITASDLEKERDRLMALLNTPIHIEGDGESIDLTLVNHLDAVTFNDPDTFASIMNSAHAQEVTPVKLDARVLIQLDKEALHQYLQENLISKIERPVSPATIYTNENGEVIIEGRGEDGLSVPYDKLIQAITTAANNGESTVNVPIEVAKAPLDISEDLQELGIKELITTGHSAYYGSSGNRMFNIEFGAAKYNGLLIPPGTEFSFNEHLGEVDAASGFVPEKVIKGDELKYEYGGGICQVSTTMYRAALLAGLPITERRPHSWKVSYYAQSMGDGLDATIYPGVTDLKFVNDTPGHILIQAYTVDAEAYFKIYGTDDGRQVTLDGPYGGGLTWRWNRTILDNEGKPMSSIEDLDENGTEEIWSRYVPIPPPKPKTPAPAPAPAPPADGF
ncbi:VanW family protein [Candidatus Peregrinibacteria bacterium]|nr:VanW family protein [Candidatus Peregrinibacteria bacterium]